MALAVTPTPAGAARELTAGIARAGAPRCVNHRRAITLRLVVRPLEGTTVTGDDDPYLQVTEIRAKRTRWSIRLRGEINSMPAHTAVVRVTDATGAHELPVAIDALNCVKQASPGLQALNGSFEGTSSFSFETGGCSFVFQRYDTTYAAAPGIGTVDAHIEGCVDFAGVPIFSFLGQFTLATANGSVAGTAEGILEPPTSDTSGAVVRLTLTVTTATGSFTGAAGTLTVDSLWSSSAAPDIDTPWVGTIAAD